METERRMFELWAAQRCPGLPLAIVGGKYVNHWIAAYWFGWLARAGKDAVVPSPEEEAEWRRRIEGCGPLPSEGESAQ